MNLRQILDAANWGKYNHIIKLFIGPGLIYEWTNIRVVRASICVQRYEIICLAREWPAQINIVL